LLLIASHLAFHNAFNIQVHTDVEAKSVVVSSDGTTPAQQMLDALKVWSEASGKPVELVA
jgi:hypothetical protein